MLKYFKNLCPRVFLLGVIFALVSLSIIGYFLSNKDDIFQNYSRSHLTISPETLFFPSAAQLITLSKKRLPEDKIAVIIGGSSVMRGAGQNEINLWSSKLEALLGDNYKVLNLAVNGGRPAGQGLYAAETLLKEGRKVIFISDIAMANTFLVPDNGRVYRSFFFDALARGYIDANDLRLNRVKSLIEAEGDPSAWDEHRIKSYTNNALNFDDFWNLIGYKYFFTIWTPLLSDNSWKGRNKLPDNEGDCIPGNGPNGGYSKNYDIEMTIMRGLSNAKLSEEIMRQEIFSSIPKSVIPNTMFVLNLYSPFYVEKLSSSERQAYNNNFNTSKKVYESFGITSVIMGMKNNQWDYCDRAHLTVSGGSNLANDLAPFVRMKAKELGYD